MTPVNSKLVKILAHVWYLVLVIYTNICTYIGFIIFNMIVAVLCCVLIRSTVHGLKNRLHDKFFSQIIAEVSKVVGCGSGPESRIPGSLTLTRIQTWIL